MKQVLPYVQLPLAVFWLSSDTGFAMPSPDTMQTLHFRRGCIYIPTSNEL